MAKQIVKRVARNGKVAKKGNGGTRVRTSAMFAPTAKIRVLAKANPFRAGSSRHAAFASLRSGVTVAAAIAHKNWGKYGVRRVRLFANRGHIAVGA